MKSITVTVSDQAYRQARVLSAELDSSLSRIVQYLLEDLPQVSRAALAFPLAKPDILHRNTETVNL
ncbi:MAG: hypothetical protein ABSG62_15660 [Terracidiphilus sp.]|jgi:hypothetical protein